MKTKLVKLLNDIERQRMVRFHLGPWSTEPPTVDGYYFACTERGWIGIVDVIVSSGVAYGWYSLHSISEFIHWIGPIPKPEPPTRAAVDAAIEVTEDD